MYHRTMRQRVTLMCDLCCNLAITECHSARFAHQHEIQETWLDIFTQPCFLAECPKIKTKPFLDNGDQIWPCTWNGKIISFAHDYNNLPSCAGASSSNAAACSASFFGSLFPPLFLPNASSTVVSPSFNALPNPINCANSS